MMLQAGVSKKIKTHVLCSLFLFSEYLFLHEIMWKNTVEQDRPQQITAHALCTPGN